MTGSQRLSAVYRVVVFDLDGTLLRGTTVSQQLARRIDRGREMTRLERKFAAGEISNDVVADISAGWFAARTLRDVQDALASGPWIAGISETLRVLASAGIEVLLATITWRFAAEVLAEWFGFSEVSGTEMRIVDGALTGQVTRYFDAEDKLRFVEDWCAERGIPMTEVAAVGDSRSDLPLFAHAGLSIALNATDAARAAATTALDGDDLRDVLPLLGLQHWPQAAPRA